MSTPGTETWARDNYGPPCNTAQFIHPVIFGRNLSVHKRAVRAFMRLDHIFKTECPAYYKLICDSPDVGTYNCRKIAGTDVYSNHAFGLAIDLRWNANARDGDHQSEMRDRAMKAIIHVEKEGFMRWGGRYTSPDDMHFEIMWSSSLLALHYRLDGTKRFSHK